MTKEIKQRIETIKSGKVPDGYIKNNVGIFPNDWVTNKTLGDIGVFGKGKGIPGNMLGTGDIPCVGYGDIYMKYNHFHFEEALSFVDKETAKESTPIQKGTLLFTVTGETAEEIGKCICYNGDETIYVGGDIITFSSKNVNPIFIAYQQYQNFSIKRKACFGQGHSVVHIQQTNLEKLPVIYPNSDTEQQKITDILLKWDKVIQLQEKLIEKLELQKKALMQRLLKPKNGWKKVKLSTILTEGSKEAVQDTSLYKKITIKLNFGGIEYADIKRKMADTRPFFLRHEGEIIIGKQNYFNGSIALVDKKFDGCICSNAIMSFIVNQCCDTYFVFQYLSQPDFMNKYSNLANGTGQKELSEKDFLNFDIVLPALDVQKSIGNILHKTNNYIEKQCKIFIKLCQQQKAMQQLLLTGIIRV